MHGSRIHMPQLAEKESLSSQDSALLSPSELLERNSRETPAGTAVTYAGSSLTWDELNRLANGVAHAVAQAGGDPASPVAGFIDRSPAWLASYVGVQRAGRAYMPLDPAYPEGRLRYMVEDAGVRLLLRGAWLECPFDDIPTLELPDPVRPAQPFDTPPVVNLLGPESPAIVLYTSGSTGKPKGVCRPVRALAMSAEALRQRLGLSEEDRLLQAAPSSHASAVAELNQHLASGGTMCLGVPDDLIPGHAMADFMERERISVALMTPSVLGLLPDRTYPDLRVLSVSGEPIPAHMVRRWGTRFSFYSNYGATETTTTAGMMVTPDSLVDGLVPSGRPSPGGVGLHILDEHGGVVPRGEVGEVWVSGPGVALGYIGDIEPGRFAELPGIAEGLCYNTGDHGRFDEDGILILAGRRDDQVKVGGVRIELEEVRGAGMSVDGVRDVVVRPHTDEQGVTRLAMYYVADVELAPTEVRAGLASQLPEAFRPTFLIPMESFPLNVIGKLDRQALPDPVAHASQAQVSRAQSLEAQGIQAPTTPGQAAKGAPSDPSAPLEVMVSQVLDAWQAGLGFRPDTTTSFGDLGGTSLTALRVLSHLDQEHGIRISLGELVSAQNAESLARTILLEAVDPSSTPSSPSAAVVPLQPEGSLPPLFFLPGINGTLLGVKGLAKRIGRGTGDAPDLPVLGLQPPGSVRAQRLQTDAQEVAESYADAIRRAYPEGPVRLLGFSAGAAFAVEVARLLSAEGRDIQFVGSLDGRNPRYRPRTSFGGIGRLLVHFPRWLISLRHRGRRHISDAAREIQRRAWEAAESGADLGFLKQVDPVTVFHDADWPEEIKRLAGTHFVALLEKDPQRYDGRLDVFYASVRGVADMIPNHLGWRDVVQNVSVQPVPGFHVGLVESAYGPRVARIVRAALNRSAR